MKLEQYLKNLQTMLYVYCYTFICIYFILKHWIWIQGKNLVHIINPSGGSKDDIDDDDDISPLLRLQKDKVFLLNNSINNLATSVARHNLISLGQCLGKFTKSGKFKLGIGSLDVLARWARYKV